jgi:phosphoenolpyruvate carboxylase
MLWGSEMIAFSNPSQEDLRSFVEILGFLQEWLLSELRGKRPLFGADLSLTDEMKDVMNTFMVIAELPSDCFGAYVISMATSPSDVLAVELLQRECRVPKPLRVVPLFEKLADLESAPAALKRLFSIDWYRSRINGKQEVKNSTSFSTQLLLKSQWVISLSEDFSGELYFMGMLA